MTAEDNRDVTVKFLAEEIALNKDVSVLHAVETELVYSR